MTTQNEQKSKAKKINKKNIIYVECFLLYNLMRIPAPMREHFSNITELSLIQKEAHSSGIVYVKTRLTGMSLKLFKVFPCVNIAP